MQMLDPARFAVVTSGEFVWALARDPKDQNFNAPFRLTCRRAEGGEVVWQSADLPDYAPYDLVGPPLLAAGKLFITAKGGAGQQPGHPQGQPQQVVLAIQPHDGKVLWKTDVGSYREGNQYYFYYGQRNNSPQPRLAYRAAMLYLETHMGVFARLDADSGALDWGYGYRTDPAQSGGGRFIFFMGEYGPQQESTATTGPPVTSGDVFLVKGAQSDRLAAIDPDRMQVVWERPIAKSARLIAALGNRALLAGPELGAIDTQSRALAWSTRVPGGSRQARILVGPDGIWQLTPRGIFELDPRTGDVRRMFRGQDLGAGGDLYLTDRWVLAVSSRSITAYPRRPLATASIPATRASDD
jgi:outer membrane protein assembly factor BamB